MGRARTSLPGPRADQCALFRRLGGRQSELRLWEKLPRHHRRRRRWLGRKSRSVKIPNRVSIRERPEDANSRREFGHWEGDTVVGDQHKTGVHTEVERVSRLLFAHPVRHIRAKETCLAQLCIFGSLPKQARQFDNIGQWE